MLVRIEGTDLPGRRCGPNPDGGWYENIHVGLCALATGPKSVIVTPGRPWRVMNPIPGDADLARWEFEVDVKEARGEFDFGGPFVRGIRDDRHIGLAWGEVSDAVPFTLHREVTLQFKDITPSTIREAIRPKRRLVGRLGLTDDGGSPRSARVLPPAVTWTAEPI